MTAIQGTFVNVKTMADGTPRLVLDLQCTLAEIAAMGLIPGVAFGIARITGAASVAASNTVKAEPKEPVGQLCIMACNFCDSAYFREWIEYITGDPCRTSDQAKAWLCELCSIESRKELDSDPIAEREFHRLVRGPFMTWRSR